MKPGDIWYIVAAAGFCESSMCPLVERRLLTFVPGGLVILILVIIWLRTWAKSRAKARRLKEPNPANERVLEGLNSPLMESAAMPGIADDYPYEEKDPYVFDEEQRQQAHPVDLDAQRPAYYYEHPNLSNPDLFGPPVPLPHHSASQHSLQPAEQDIAAARGFSDESHNPYSSPYGAHAPLPSPHDHSDYEYEYNSSSQDHQMPPGMAPAQLRVDIPPSQSYFSVRSPTEYATPESYRSPDGDYNLVTPTYPDPGMRRVATRSPPGEVDSYTSIPAGIASGRTSVVPQINGNFPEYPPLARSPIKSPARSARSERSETSSQARWLARYGRTPPVPERPLGLAHYASGLGSQDEHEPEEDYADGRTFGRGGSSDDHSLGVGGSQSQHLVDNGYLYDVPTVTANQPITPWRARRMYG